MAYVERGSGPTVFSYMGRLTTTGTGTANRIPTLSLQGYIGQFAPLLSGTVEGRRRVLAQLHSEDLVSFIERLGGPVHLVGHSRGGPVAWRRHTLARPGPKLVLMDPALFVLLPIPSGATTRTPGLGALTQPRFT